MNLLSIINWSSLIIFYALLILFFYSRKKDLVIQWYVFFIYRTQKGLDFVRKIAVKFNKFWKIYGYVSIPVGFIFMIFILGTLISAVVTLIKAPSAAVPAAGIVLPWATTGTHGPIITVTIWYFVLAIAITVLVHEGAHAVVAAAHKIKLKSAGVGMFALIPFAFVEPDESAVEKTKTSKQLSVFAAAPFTNIILATLIGSLALFAVIPAIASNTQINGLEITAISELLPAGASELAVGDIVMQVDNTSFADVAAERAIAISPDYEAAVRMPYEKYECLETEPGQEVKILTADGKEVSLTTVASEKDSVKGIMGLSFGHVVEPKSGSGLKIGFLGIVYAALAWIAIFNFGIGLFNLLPLGPLDGGRIVKTSLEKIFKKRKIVGMKLFALISILTLFTLLLSIFGPYVVNLF